jgi:SulP family sulfate permease
MTTDKPIGSQARFPLRLRDVVTEVLAGLIVSTVAIAYCVGFAAMIFEGPIADGLPTGLWSMLVGTAIACVALGLLTSLPPTVGTQEAIAIGMLKVVAVAMVSGSHTAGATPDQTVVNVMAGMMIATLAAGFGLLVVGFSGIGQMLRFVPSAVTGGFLCATGVVVWTASLRMATGDTLSNVVANVTSDAAMIVRLAVSLAFFAAVLALRRLIRSPLLLPLMFITCSAVVVLLHRTHVVPGLDDWFATDARQVRPWIPLAGGALAAVDWSVVRSNLADVVAVPFVLIVSLVVRTSSFEMAFNRTADFNSEFKAHGAAALVAGIIGGTMAAAAQGSIRLLHELGARTVLPSYIVAIVILVLLLTGVDLTAVFPLPLLSGLLLLVGWSILRSALEQPLRQRAWSELVVIGLILLVSLKAGFFAAVVVGFAVSSLLFVVKYSQVDVIRRQLTRRTFASHVARSAEDERRLSREGDAIHVCWLSGFLFFGSSHRVVELVRRSIEKQAPRPVRFLVLDFSGVSGIDTSAVQSLAGLARLCADKSIVVLCSGLSADVAPMIGNSMLLSPPHPSNCFADHNAALAWAEERVLADTGAAALASQDFEAWIGREIGTAEPSRLLSYFKIRTVSPGEALYEEGSPADTIDIIAHGTIAITVAVGGKRIEVRRMEQRTVVGEMGFFRNQTRSASVLAIEPVTVYTLDRTDFEQMQHSAPEVARALLVFLIRTLSDRLEFANGAIRSLTAV